MDVILDSNIYLNDPKFQGTHSPELLAYLRRTGDTLVLPKLIMDEVLERYGDQLRNDLNTSKRAWGVLAKTRMSSHPPFASVDLDKEVEAYKHLLLAPAPGIKVLQYSDVSGIDVNEIARRGIKRIKPASQTGEELRDVYLWLLVFQYARQIQKEVAFISGDKGFRVSKDEDALHPDLESEIADSKLPIHFYRELSIFVTSQALKRESVDAEWFSQFVNTDQLNENIRETIFATETHRGWAHEVTIDTIRFSEGTEYQVSQRSLYAELEYGGRVRLVFKTIPLPVMNNLFIRGDTTKLNQTPEIVYTVSPPRHQNGQDLYTTQIEVLASPAGRPMLRDLGFINDERSFLFNVWVSARIENDKLVSWQCDGIRLIEV